MHVTPSEVPMGHTHCTFLDFATAWECNQNDVQRCQQRHQHHHQYDHTCCNNCHSIAEAKVTGQHSPKQLPPREYMTMASRSRNPYVSGKGGQEKCADWYLKPDKHKTRISPLLKFAAVTQLREKQGAWVGHPPSAGRVKAQGKVGTDRSCQWGMCGEKLNCTWLHTQQIQCYITSSCMLGITAT